VARHTAGPAKTANNSVQNRGILSEVVAASSIVVNFIGTSGDLSCATRRKAGTMQGHLLLY
jgi:hypothetical protein